MLINPILRTLLMLMIACVLAGTSPFCAPVLVVTGKLLLVGAAAFSFSFTARWWQARRLALEPPEVYLGADATWAHSNPQTARYLQTGLWYFGAAWKVTWGLWCLVWLWPLAMLLQTNVWLNGLAAVSPLASLLSLTPRADEFLQGLHLGFAKLPPWWAGVFLQPLLALAFARLAMRLRRTDTKSVESEGWWSRSTERLRQWNERLILVVADRLTERFDNPVALKDLRIRARRENWATQEIVVTGLVTLGVLMAMALMIWGTLFSGKPSAQFLLTHYLTGVCPQLGLFSIPAQLFVSVLIPLWMLEWIITSALGCQSGMAFDHERDASTLGFLLLTPLTDREVLLGKWVGYSLDSWLGALSGKPMFALLVAAAVLSGAWPVLLFFVAFVAFMAALLFAGSATGVTLSARCRTRTAGTGWTALMLISSQCAFAVMLLGWYRTPTLLGYLPPLAALTALHLAWGALMLRWGAAVIGRMRTHEVAFEGQKREN